MAKKISGYREVTLQNMTTSAAVVVKNFDVATDTLETIKDKILTATSGGVKVKVEYPSAWDKTIDGVPANSVGMREQEECKPTVTFTPAEAADPQVFAAALGASVVTDATSEREGYTKIEPKWGIEAADYLDNLALITTRKGSDEPLIIVIDKPLSTEGFELSTADKAQGAYEVTFTGNYDPAKLDVPPIHIYTVDVTKA